MVNTQGQRFCNEQVYGATLGHAMIEKQGGKAWLILDSSLRWQSTRQCLFGRLWAFQSMPAMAMIQAVPNHHLVEAAQLRLAAGRSGRSRRTPQPSFRPRCC